MKKCLTNPHLPGKEFFNQLLNSMSHDQIWVTGKSGFNDRLNFNLFSFPNLIYESIQTV